MSYASYTSPLDLQSQQIRVISILPRTSDGTLRCQLDTQVLDDESNLLGYSAVSYTWGDASQTRSILLNGSPFPVRENLWNFLDQMERNHDDQQLPLWIDALSINQSDLTERSHQVALMGKIYSRASSVVVWLGPGTEETDKHLPTLETLSQIPSEKVDTSTWDPDFVSCMLDICYLPYWTRVWIVQEFILAHELFVMCGSRTIPGSALMWLYDRVSSQRELSLSDYRLLHSLASKILDERRNWSFQRPFSELLDTFWTLECADRRDRIYGMLALVDPMDLELLELKPDYTMSAHDLCRKLLREFDRPKFKLIRLMVGHSLVEDFHLEENAGLG